MSVKPILFSGPMVKALLEGRKTQTRRVLKGVPSMPEANCHPNSKQRHSKPYLDAYCSERRTAQNPRGMSCDWCWWQVDDRMCPPTFKVKHAPGDVLYVREAWNGYIEKISGTTGAPFVSYRATDEGDYLPGMKWKPSIHMPRWASRITLPVTNVRVERLQDISEEDAKAEGAEEQFRTVVPIDGKPLGCKAPYHMPCSYRAGFANLWNSLNAKRGYGWDANPWVSVTEWKEIHVQNVDEFLKAKALSTPA